VATVLGLSWHPSYLFRSYNVDKINAKSYISGCQKLYIAVSSSIFNNPKYLSMNSYDSGNAAMAAGIVGIIMSFLWIIMVVAVFLIVCHWKIYSKAGKPGWAAIVPIYSTLVLLDIVGKPWWWLLLMFIPFVNIIIAIIVINELSKSFGKGGGFTVGLIFLPIIFYPILAFDSSTYTPPTAAV